MNATILLSEQTEISYFISREFKENNNQRLIVCPNEEQAGLLENEINSFLDFFELKEKVLRLPSHDLKVLTGVHPNLAIKHDRLNALFNLIHSPTSFIFITSIEGLLQRTIPIKLFNSSVITWVQGKTTIQRENIKSTLFEMGYIESDVVSSVGTFCIRGEVLDFYPPSEVLPFRVHFFDDAIETISHFNPDTQRSISNLKFENIVFGPCQEVLLNAETIKNLKVEIKNHCDTHHISRKTRDPILSFITYNCYTHFDTWSGFAYKNNPTTALDYFLNKKTPITLIDKDAALKTIDFLKNSSTSEDLIIPNIFDYYDFNSEPILTQNISQIINPLGAKTHNNQLSKKFTCFSNIEEVRSIIRSNFKICFFTHANTSVSKLEKTLKLDESIHPMFLVKKGSICSSLIAIEEKIIFLNEHGTFNSKKELIKKERKINGEEINDSNPFFSESIQVNDLIVHKEHGVGKFIETKRVAKNNSEIDFVLLEYSEGDKLYIPTYHLDQLHKHRGKNTDKQLDSLRQKKFQKTLQNARSSIKALAFDLIQIYATRATAVGVKMPPTDETYDLFASKFYFQETIDQTAAISDIFKDLESGKIMDRLVCGDVGFGKTEVAMRAAFWVAYLGKQVAILTPTTLLARQHEMTFRDRFKDFAFKINSFSRLKSKNEQKTILEELKEGRLDIIIGTHRLLSKDVSYLDLGLLIIDEEHRFGVEHKEKIKLIKNHVHTLTLTATPIPRTLNAALSGIRDISLIKSPPMQRLPIKTYIADFDWELIKTVIENELSRDGQVFFVNNNISELEKLELNLKKLFPNIEISTTHGHLPEVRLEKEMLKFYDKKSKILLTTTIIESGLDIPNANTIIINQAHQFGLAQLYQLRGRVGRSHIQGFCYLMVPEVINLDKTAKERLTTMQRFVELGSGFNIASRDLEIRGGGNLLGAEQSGHIENIGLELYFDLLNEAINQIKSKGDLDELEARIEKPPEIVLPFSSFIDEKYIPNLSERLRFYKKISNSKSESKIIDIYQELNDRYGHPPVELDNLFWAIRIRNLLITHRVDALISTRNKSSISFKDDFNINANKLIDLVNKNPTKIKFESNQKIVLTHSLYDASSFFNELENFFNSVS